jgi:nitrogen fixation/metabolism regulation signal transduction histidine kinase
LSAERLQRKLLPNLEETQAKVLCRSTDTIVQQVKAMKSMVNAFAEYARTPEIDIRPLDFNNLIHDIAEMYHSNSAGAEVRVELDPNVPQVEVDAGRIRQLVHNLIKNALEALEGRSDGVVDVSTRCIEDSGCRFVELEIADNGTGIPQELMEHLFEPYVTSKVKGNGLGLAIVKKIAEENGGVVWADSVPGDGAKITVRLQAATQPGQQTERELRRRSA